MKKTSVMCMMVVCLAMSGFSSAMGCGPSEQEAERIRKDAAKRREYLEGYIRHPVAEKDIPELRRLLGLSDDKVMQAEVMDIISKLSAKVGWKWFKGNVTRDEEIATILLLKTIDWLSICADAEGKKLLMDIATDNAKYDDFRRSAVHSYLRRADAQETRDAFSRFLADDMRGELNCYGEVYRLAIQAYDKAEGDTQTREAIVAAMSAALAKEENKTTFTNMDKLLAERSKEYAESPQRKAALERFNKPLESKTP